jgi:small-conductance mechanosensitive channel
MSEVIRLVGPNNAVQLFGVTLVGVNATNARKLLFTLVFIALVVLVARGLRRASLWLVRGRASERAVFWARQGINLAAAAVLFIGVVSIWFDDPVRLATALGLITAGLAFALQKVVTAVAGYFVILRGQTFNVGDRIVMGGVRGDVIALGFTQTTIMEMGQPPPVQKDDPAMWVQSRQYTGRLVSVSNARIFDEPVYNYTREFPYLWEELAVPIPYAADRTRAERILLAAAEKHGVAVSELGAEVLAELQRRYFLKPADVRPRVYLRLTDDWLELTVRFVVRDHGIRDQKDAISRDVLAGLDAAGIPIASATFDIVGLPPVRLADAPPRPARREAS